MIAEVKTIREHLQGVKWKGERGEERRWGGRRAEADRGEKGGEEEQNRVCFKG